MQVVKKDAFTIMEILVVVFIIGLLATLIGPRVVDLLRRGKTTATQATLHSIKGALSEYQMDVGHFPSTRHGLQALVENVENHKKWNGSYLAGQEDVPQDSWGFDFIYNRPPEHFKKRFRYFEVISYGPEGEGSPEDDWLFAGE